MTKQEIIRVILQEARSEVRRQGFSFSSEGDAYLVKFVTNGVNGNMSLHDCNTQSRIDLAKNNMREIVIELCAHERRRNNMIVDSRTFSESHFHICPRFPFC